MAPVPVLRMPPGEHIRQISRSISSSLPALETRSAGPSSITPTSFFGAILRRASSFSSHALNTRSQSPRYPSEGLSLPKRQNGAILAIPTTYAGLNAGPAAGTVVGIVLGAVGGFLLCLYLIYTATRLSGRFGSRVVEEEVIRRRSRSPPRRSRSRSETMEVRSERSDPPPPPRRQRTRETRETIVVEETIRRAPSPPPDDDIVEVIEEHSPERRPSRKESKRTSGFRTVDPAEFGGGGQPMRKVSRR